MNLPTEAQWEYAARSNKDQEAFIWGDEPLSENSRMINIWQGDFPNQNLKLTSLDNQTLYYISFIQSNDHTS